MSILTDKEVTFCLADVTIIANVALIFINNIRIHINRDLILKTKSITNFVNDQSTAFSFIFLQHVVNLSINCFLLCRETLPKNSKQMKISFLSELVLEDLKVMNRFIYIKKIIKKIIRRHKNIASQFYHDLYNSLNVSIA